MTFVEQAAAHAQPAAEQRKAALARADKAPPRTKTGTDDEWSEF